MDYVCNFDKFSNNVEPRIDVHINCRNKIRLQRNSRTIVIYK